MLNLYENINKPKTPKDQVDRLINHLTRWKNIININFQYYEELGEIDYLLGQLLSYFEDNVTQQNLDDNRMFIKYTIKDQNTGKNKTKITSLEQIIYLNN